MVILAKTRNENYAICYDRERLRECRCLTRLSAGLRAECAAAERVDYPGVFIDLDL
jgi:hypothetical protein